MEEQTLQNEETKKFKTFYERHPIVAWTTVISGAIPVKNDKFAKYYDAIMYFLVLYLLSGHAILVYSIHGNILKNNMVDAMKQLSVLNVVILGVIKTITRIFYKRKMADMLKEIDEDYEDYNSLDEEYQKVLEKSNRDGAFFEKLWLFFCVISAICIESKPLYDMMKSALTENIFTRQMLFDADLPFLNEIKMDSPVYEIVSIYILLVMIILCMIFLSFDPVFVIFLVHSCANLKIVNSLLRNLFMHEAGGYDAARVKQKMKQIVMLHHKVIRCVDDMQSIYWSFILATFFLSTLLICGSLYILVTSLENCVFQYETLLGSIIYFNLFILSYFGEKLVEESEKVGESAYCCGWENYPDPSIRKNIQLIIMRSQRPLQLSSKFSFLSMASFSVILQTSWSYYNLMRSMRK